jgi:hypothetical protein
MANPNSILAFESRFGPQSNLIDIAAFVQSASNQTPFQADEVDHDVVKSAGALPPFPRLCQTGIHEDQRSVDDLKVFSGGCLE